MQTEIKRPKTYRSIAWRIIALTLALWIGCMGGLTWCVAADMLHQMHGQINLFLNSNQSISRGQNERSDLPGTLEHNMIQRLGYPYFIIQLDRLLPIVHRQQLQNLLSSDDWLWGKWDLQYGFDATVNYYGEDMKLLIHGGSYLTFTYTTEDNWFDRNTAATGKGYVAFDRIPGGPDVADKILTNHPIGSMSTDMLFPLLRMTGYFEGNAFHPTTIDFGNTIIYGEPIEDLDRLSDLDARQKIEWNNLLTLAAPEGHTQEIIYAWDAGGFHCPQKEISMKGDTFSSLSALLHHDLTCTEPGSYRQDSMFHSVLIGKRNFTDAYGNYTIAVAVHCKPLQYAFLRLTHVYLISLAAVILCLILLLWKIKCHLIEPLDRLVHASQSGTVITPSARLQELHALEIHFAEAQQILSQCKIEIQQLHTALDYAHDSEQRRKQLVSNITHELKTPLAIIHGNAECLQEDTDGTYPEKYVVTILEETERMDAMVIQMLDLSRLEAGKIRLASDPCSLLALTKTITKKMAPLFEARKLAVHIECKEDFSITADEARIEQVITNLLTNAQKHSVEGGNIHIQISLDQGNACYHIANEATHLSKEALEKVWDSFYRADEARSTAGVGLGLALVKSIIALHGGCCSVQNIQMPSGMDGVDFGFVLPLK